MHAAKAFVSRHKRLSSMYFARRRGKEGEHLALCIHVPVDAIDRVKNITVSHSSNLLSHHRPCCKLQDKLCLLDLWELS